MIIASIIRIKPGRKKNALFQRGKNSKRQAPKERKGIRGKIFCIVFFCLIILSGCATKNATKQISEEDLLRTRVQEYWNHRVKLELDKCYYYEYPLLRKKVTLVEYIQSFNTEFTKWKDFAVRSIEFFDKDRAEVRLSITVEMKLPMVKRFDDVSEVTEEWIKFDGVWYHVSKRYL